jgi:hypothetical protein
VVAPKSAKTPSVPICEGEDFPDLSAEKETRFNPQINPSVNINTITMKLAIFATLLTAASAFSVGKVRTYFARSIVFMSSSRIFVRDLERSLLQL